MKKCPKCQEEKELELFYVSKDKKDGRSCWCKSCISERGINKAIKKRNGRRPYSKYIVNQDCFDGDSLESWYIAGLIAADGNLSTQKKTNSQQVKNKLQLTLKMEDIDTILLFKNFFKYSGVISFYKGIYPTCIINGIPKIADVLKNKFNITDKKSLTLKPPKNIPSLDHALSFIVGYIDGDGCIYVKGNLHQMQVLGTQDMLNFIIKTFEQILDFPITIKPRPASCKTVSQINFSGNLLSGKYSPLIHKILSLPIPRMKRKWGKLELCQEYLSSISPEPSTYLPLKGDFESK